MDFLKKHYEKLALVALALIVLGVMLHVLQIIDRTRAVKDSDLRIPTRQADYEEQDSSKNEFKSDMLVSSTAPDWRKSQSRISINAQHFSDLVDVFPMAECPHEGCHKIVPLYYFADGRNCPECGNALKTPPERPKGRVGLITADDSDGDGIKNLDEQRFNLNANDPKDALQDLDGDGFSNIYEIEQGTSPINPTEHPPMWRRLRFVGLDRVALPISFKALNTNDSTDKKKWDVQFNVKRRNWKGEMVERTSVESMGGIVTIDKRDYRITDLVAGKTAAETKVVLTEMPENKDVTPDVMEIKLGEPAYSSDRRIILEDIGKLPDPMTGKRDVYMLRQGDEFVVGEDRMLRVRGEKYVLHSFNETAKTAVLNRVGGRGGDMSKDASGKSMLVTPRSGIPDDSWVMYPVTKNENMDAGDGTGMN